MNQTPPPPSGDALEIVDRPSFAPLVVIFACGVLLALSSQYPMLISFIAIGSLFGFAKWKQLVLLYIPFLLWASESFLVQFGHNLSSTDLIPVYDLLRSSTLVAMMIGGLAYKEVCKQVIRDAYQQSVRLGWNQRDFLVRLTILDKLRRQYRVVERVNQSVINRHDLP